MTQILRVAFDLQADVTALVQFRGVDLSGVPLDLPVNPAVSPFLRLRASKDVSGYALIVIQQREEPATPPRYTFSLVPHFGG